SEEHTSELQSRENLVCRLLLEKKDLIIIQSHPQQFGTGSQKVCGTDGLICPGSRSYFSGPFHYKGHPMSPFKNIGIMAPVNSTGIMALGQHFIHTGGGGTSVVTGKDYDCVLFY